MHKWIVREQNLELFNILSKEKGVTTLAAKTLAARNYDINFLTADKISDPFLIKDMEPAVEIINNALYSGEKITIYGDYDCDGITGTVMLYHYLTALGGDVDWYIPSRDEGYGLNIPAIDTLINNGTQLIVTVDNGISAVEEVAYIKEKGIKVIVTDHHKVPSELPPADAVINPHRNDDNSPFKPLAGCGVVLKLIMAMENDVESIMEQFSDLAAIGTIGDLVPLEGENRCIVKQGLRAIPYTENIGLHALLKISGIDSDNINSTTLAFTICPRINAAGRISHAREAVELLLCESGGQAESLALRLSELNTERQNIEKGIIDQVGEWLKANTDRLYDRVMICEGENWHQGVVGIVSSRLLTKYMKPNIVISIDGETARGSARSYAGFSLYNLLTHCKDLLIRYGGHERAAGFSIKTKWLPEFLDRVRQYTEKNFSVMPHSTISVDLILQTEDLLMENVEHLSFLQPFGESNSQPIFRLKDVTIISKRALKDGKYVSFNVKFGNSDIKVLNFNSTYDAFHYQVGDRIDILVTLDINEYNDIKKISAFAKDIRSANFSEDKYFAAELVYENLRRNENINPSLKKRIIPEKEHLKIVYDILRVTEWFNTARDLAMDKGLNFCMFCVILDIFDEFNLLKRDIINNKLILNTSGEKIDFLKSEMLSKYKLLFKH